jgi:hypothetical protein
LWLYFLRDGTTSLATKITKSTKENGKRPPCRVRTGDGSESYCHPEFPQRTNVIRPVTAQMSTKLADALMVGYSRGWKTRVAPSSTIINPTQIVISTTDAPKYESAICPEAAAIHAVGSFADMTPPLSPSSAAIESQA